MYMQKALSLEFILMLGRMNFPRWVKSLEVENSEMIIIFQNIKHAILLYESYLFLQHIWLCSSGFLHVKFDQDHFIMKLMMQSYLLRGLVSLIPWWMLTSKCALPS